MKKDMLISKIKDCALARFELYADDNDLRGLKRGRFLSDKIRMLNCELFTLNEKGLMHYLEHQRFILSKELSKRRVYECTKNYIAF